MPPKSSTAVAVATPATLDNEELMALLRQSGMISPETTSYRRMRLDGGILNLLDAQGEVEEAFPPKMGKGGVPLPSCTVRIVKPPVYYNAFWLGPETDDKGRATGGTDPGRIGRSDLNKTFAKRYDDESEQAKDTSPGNEVYDQIAALTGRRGDFKGDLQLQVMPEDGEFKGDETVYTFTLSASACLDFRGSRKDPEAGIVQEQNFIVQLGALAAKIGIENGATTKAELEKWVLDGMEALQMGGVVADIYLLRASNSDGSQTWTIPAFKPVHIEFANYTAALTGPAEGQTTDEEAAAPSDDPGF